MFVGYIIIFISIIIIIKYAIYKKETKEFITSFDNNIKTKNRSIFKTKIVGVTFTNDDGSKRQDLIKSLNIEDSVILEPYIYNDRDAIYVKNVDGKILGNIPKVATKNIKQYLDKGIVLSANISNIGSFTNEDNIEIFYAKICMSLDTQLLLK